MPLDNWSNYTDSGARWFTAAPGTNHGDLVDLIPYIKTDEDDPQYAQTPERSWNPLSISFSHLSLASVPSTVPEGDPEEQWNQPRNDVYKDEAGPLRFPDGQWQPCNIYNTEGPVERTLYDNDDYEDISSVE